MAKGEGQRIRILYVLQLLWEQSDEEHPLTAVKILDGLARKGITCERKTIYSDLAVLEEFGIDIIRTQKGAYIGRRGFELPELKLLVDAVQASRFITEKKSDVLIDKLSRLLSQQKRRQLKRQIYVRNRVKTMNESIYYNVDAMNEAMNRNRKISFTYWKWNTRKELEVKQRGEAYCISPWLLLWENERYYLVGFDERVQSLRHFRVDKMQDIQILEDRRMGREAFEDIDVASYGIENFGMFQGKRERVTLIVDDELVGVVIDRFGKQVWLHKKEESHCVAVVDVVVSNQFFGWLTGLGGKVRIVNPKWVKNTYRDMLRQLMELEDCDNGT